MGCTREKTFGENQTLWRVGIHISHSVNQRWYVNGTDCPIYGNPFFVLEFTDVIDPALDCPLAVHVARVVGGEVRRCNATGTTSAGGTDVPLRQHGQEGPKDVLLLMVLLPPFVEALKEAVSRCIEIELIYIIILYDITR